MTLSIKKPSVRLCPVTTLSLRWSGPLKERSVACTFKCSACNKKLGARRFGTAWISDNGATRSMRLCEDCAKKAATDPNCVEVYGK